MISTAIDITKNNIHMIGQSHLRPKKRKDMETMLILVAFPFGNILISQARIFLCPPITEHMYSQLKFYITQRIKNSLRLYPESRQRISFHNRTGIFIIFKETYIIQLDR